MSINTTMLAPSTVTLVGRVLRLGREAPEGAAAREGGGGDVRRAAEEPRVLVPAQQEGYLGSSQLVAAMDRGDLRLAHIFGFAHEGRYTPMHVPALFLVHTNGQDVLAAGETEIDPARLGLAHLEKGNLTFASDLKFWTYDRGDETIRLDVSTGTLLQLVVDAETGPAGGQGRRIDVFGQEGSIHARLARGSY
jgi:hypothetical protein